MHVKSVGLSSKGLAEGIWFDTRDEYIEIRVLKRAYWGSRFYLCKYGAHLGLEGFKWLKKAQVQEISFKVLGAQKDWEWALLTEIEIRLLYARAQKGLV